MEELKPYAEEMLFDRGVAAADDHPLCTHYGTFAVSSAYLERYINQVTAEGKT